MNSTTLTEAGQLAFDNLKLLRRAAVALDVAAWRDETFDEVCSAHELAGDLEALSERLACLHLHGTTEVAA